MLEERPVAHAQGGQHRGVEPALDGLVAHAVLVQVPIQLGPGLVDAEVHQALVVALLALQQQQQPDVLHAETLVVVDHEMIGHRQVVADAVLGQAGEDPAGGLALFRSHPAVQVVVVEEGPEFAGRVGVAVGGRGFFQGPQAIPVRLGIHAFEFRLKTGDLRRQVGGQALAEVVILGHQGVEGAFGGRDAFPLDAEGRRGLLPQGDLGPQTGDFVGGGQDPGIDARGRHRQDALLIKPRGGIVDRHLGRGGPEVSPQGVLGRDHHPGLPVRGLVVGPVGGIRRPGPGCQKDEGGGTQGEEAGHGRGPGVG